MGKLIKDTIHAQGIDIGIYTTDFENEFISLTDIAKYKSDEPAAVIQNWMRNRDVIEFLGLWEMLHNRDFKPLEFEEFKNHAGANISQSGKLQCSVNKSGKESERENAVITRIGCSTVTNIGNYKYGKFAGY